MRQWPVSNRAASGLCRKYSAMAGIVLALDSIWILIPVMVALIITVIRTSLEDKTLQNELPGYRDYVRRVRYRLIPGVF